MNKVLLFIACFVSLSVIAETPNYQAPAQQNYRYQYAEGQGGAGASEAVQAAQAKAQAETEAAQQQSQQVAAIEKPKAVFSEEEKDLVNTTPEKLIAMTPEQRKKALEEGAFDFSDEDAYIDVEDAVHYKQFVQRHLLSKAIVDSAPVALDSFFINLLTTTSYVHQQGDGINVKWAEFVTGGMTLSAGYALSGGHMIEIGANASAIGNIFAGYRYFLGTNIWTVWPYAGIGYGIAMSALDISDGPDEVTAYRGKTSLINSVLGILLPLPDVAVRVEVRADFWGSDRIVVTPSFGLILYL